MRPALHFAWHLILGWGGVAIGLAAAAYYGPRKMLETWDWYMYRFRDKAVLAVIDERRIIKASDLGPAWLNSQPKEVPYTPEEIGQRLARSVTSISRSLERLRANKKATKMKTGWYSAELAKGKS